MLTLFWSVPFRAADQLIVVIINVSAHVASSEVLVVPPEKGSFGMQ